MGHTYIHTYILLNGTLRYFINWDIQKEKSNRVHLSRWLHKSSVHRLSEFSIQILKIALYLLHLSDFFFDSQKLHVKNNLNKRRLFFVIMPCKTALRVLIPFLGLKFKEDITLSKLLYRIHFFVISLWFSTF